MNRLIMRAVLLLVLLASPSLMTAAETPPDYSREALLLMFGDFYAPEQPKSLDWNVEVAGSKVRLRFMPLVVPLLATAARTDLMPAVSAFDLLNVSFPTTRAMVAVDDRSVRKAIRQIERRRAREAALRE